VPKGTVSSSGSDLYSDLDALQSHLSTNEALYILLRQKTTTNSYTAITYVPDTAPVRQKTLFASTRLTLVRELGSEHFTETLFATTKEELSAQGWKKHEAHVAEDAPLTQEEWDRKQLKEAEVQEVGGTGRRGAGYGGGNSSSGLPMTASKEAVEALKKLGESDGGLVLLGISQSEQIELVREESGVTLGNLASYISDKEPRYSFYRHQFEGESGPESAVIFIYTCPTATPVKQRMIYASSKRMVGLLAERDVGLKIAKSIEATDPSEVTAKSIEEEFAVKQEVKSGFARPKRPGKR
jgi:twinfilin-like protein